MSEEEAAGYDYDRLRADYPTDEAMARAMLRQVMVLEHAAAIARHQRNRAEAKLFSYQNPIKRIHPNGEAT